MTAPVSVPDRATSSGVPAAAILPPSAPGPRSMIQSVQTITSGLCSMTITE